MRHTRRWSLMLSGVLAYLAAPFAATQPVAQTNDDKVVVADPVVVTARLIEEPIQRIPFGITVVDGSDVEDRRIDGSLSLSRTTPGLNSAGFGVRNGFFPNVRGVGSFFPLSGDDASVPVFIDGVPLAVRSQDRDLFDVQRVEVLRGPQNTLYGRNAQAGAISITSIAPSFVPEARLNFEAGTDGYGRVEAAVSGPLHEDIAGRLAVRVNTEGGDVPNDAAPQTQRSGNVANLAGSLLWDASGRTEARLNLRYGNYDETPLGPLFADLPGFPRAFQETSPIYELETLGAGITVEHEFENEINLTSISGFQTYQTFFTQDDTDGYILEAITGLPPVFANNPAADFRVIEDDDVQFSQELRLDGGIGDGGSWVGGLSFYRNALDLTADFNSTGFVIGTFDNDFTTTGYSAFGEVTYPVMDGVRVFGGLRYTLEQKDYDTVFTDGSGRTLGFDSADSGDDTFTLVTGRAGLTYDLTPSVTAFASVARGGKTGGFQLGDLDVSAGRTVSSFENALTWTGEVGVRGTLFGDRVSFSASGFFNDTKDEHLQVFDLTTFEFIIENADTQTYGFELEGVVQATPWLRFDGSLAFLETEITSSDDPSVRSGNDVPYAPRITFALGTEFQTDFAIYGYDGALTARAEYQFVGERKGDAQNLVTLDSYGLVNLRAGWSGEHLEVYAFAENAFDEDYVDAIGIFGTGPTGAPVTSASPGLPARYGVGLTLNF